MRLTDEMIQEDDKRFKRENLLAEFNYCGKEVPKRKSITNDDIRFYAWLCRSAYTMLKEQEEVKPKYNARTNWYECGNCHYSMTSGMHCRSELIPATKVRYCANCGFPVNWEGR